MRHIVFAFGMFTWPNVWQQDDWDFTVSPAQTCVTWMHNARFIKLISVHARQVLPLQTGKAFSWWTWLCIQRHCHVETGKGLPHTAAIEIKAHYCLKINCMLWLWMWSPMLLHLKVSLPLMRRTQSVKAVVYLKINK